MQSAFFVFGKQKQRCGSFGSAETATAQ